MTVLDVNNLTVQFGETVIIDHISFSLNAQEVLGIVGESGSGKTKTAETILRILPSTAKVSSGSIQFAGENLLEVSEKKMQRIIRGEKIVMIPQDPAGSLSPVSDIGGQTREMPKYHRPDIKKKDQKEFVISLLRKVGIPDPEKRYDSFPHEFSGGMNQRVWIAMALAVKPAIIIADEPTTALDVTVQAKILDMLVSSAKELETSLILITHNLGIVAEYADRVLVMKKGKIVEEGSVFQIFSEPKDDYTKHLLEVVPRI